MTEQSNKVESTDSAPEVAPANSLSVPTAKIVKILKTDIWVEGDFFGGKHVVVQHEGMEPFTYASFYYNYAYTSNAGIRDQANALAVSLGATEPVQQRNREFGFPEKEEVDLALRLLKSELQRDKLVSMLKLAKSHIEGGQGQSDFSIEKLDDLLKEVEEAMRK